MLPRYLGAAARRLAQQEPEHEDSRAIVVRWADLEQGGHLQKKETSLDADFLLEVFGEALHYRAGTKSPEEYHLERSFTVPGVGTADGALGVFGPGRAPEPVAVIELKSADTNLDTDKFNGRTAVQQCWDYLNALPNCPWGIVSNFVTFRLYHREKTPAAFEYFTLQELRNETRFWEFYTLFEYGGLLKSILGQPPRALRLVKETDERQHEVGNELYEAYSRNRLALIEHLFTQEGKEFDVAIHVAQKLLDRIIFIAFCEDRQLLPGKVIESTYQAVPPLARATNPRWRNFIDLFHAIDKGHPNLELESGYDGGLFRHDPDVDELQLDDDWTDFFREVGGYDFRDEVNVDVLGHLFEKSVTELERLRQGGLFGAVPSKASAMPKSAQRKRFGIYYTPLDFTTFVVRSTLGALIEARFAAIAKAHGVDPDARSSATDGRKVAAYWRGCLAALREIKVCDPACGSGAFLIQAYEVLEDYYNEVVNALAFHENSAAAELSDSIAEMILGENLFGVDLSTEAVEITQLALWIRSARRGKTLADLSSNIVCGNSLVADAAVDAKALDWERVFPRVFSRGKGGFDCVIGNPPWERLKLQEREFFAASAPEIAGAVSAAKRRTLIARLEKGNPDLFARYTRAKEDADGALRYARTCGRFPLTAKGDINTYMLFAELARTIVAPTGRVGLLVPSGIATDDTTKVFFGELMGAESLIKLYDFENREGIFPDVHRSFKFCTLIFGGSEVETASADFVFFAHKMADLADGERHISLSSEDMKLLNPNTRTCPIFRSRRDAELTKAIYRRVPVLIDESGTEAVNPWGIGFFRMFDQTNDAELFHTRERLQDMGFIQKGNRWVRKKQVYLPLYEAKMVQAYDHRAASVVVDEEKWVRQGQTAETSLVSHQDAKYGVEPRWWVSDGAVSEALRGDSSPAFLCYKDVTSPTNERTMIAALIPRVGVVNSAPLVLPSYECAPRRLCCLLANLNSFALDFVARQKVGNVHLNFFLVKQFPVFPPDAYAEQCPWAGRHRLEKWISERVLKLTCTAEDMRPFAEAAGFDPPIHRWDPAERAELMAELDAAYFHLYGVSRDDTEYILSTFTGTARRDEGECGYFRTAKLVLAAYDEFCG
ncbi:MAG: N-6 DNA methylase [Phycisphaerae bacterium]|nr:N-6 DNA methylase [Phycisphaerae bacterium]